MATLVNNFDILPPMPWFGLDIGGTLVKLVYFEKTDDYDLPETEAENLRLIGGYLKQQKSYGASGFRDEHLEMKNVSINRRVGSLHFIRFSTNQMAAFIALAKSKGMAHFSSTVCATGGGAFKFEEDFRRELNLKLHKFDEFDSLIRGVDFIFNNNHPSELYYFNNPVADDSTSNYLSSNSIYPYMLVNIGSGVSILSVTGSNCFRRVSGSSLGGGTFLGLASLLTGCQSFEEALELAADGDNTRVDKLVRDIYGGDFSRFNLAGDVVASSFGQMNFADRRIGARREDLARATLVTITNNIGSIVGLCSRNENIERVIFVGNFLRINKISMKMLSSAMDFWSKGSVRALFCQHEGYFGAVGCMLELISS